MQKTVRIERKVVELGGLKAKTVRNMIFGKGLEYYVTINENKNCGLQGI